MLWTIRIEVPKYLPTHVKEKKNKTILLIDLLQAIGTTIIHR